MKLEIPNATIHAGQRFHVELDDQGKALVALKFEVWQGTTLHKEIFHSKTMDGPKTGLVELSPGTYDCMITIAATRKKSSLGGTYKSSVTMIDAAGARTLICSTKGTVSESRATDADADLLPLIVS